MKMGPLTTVVVDILILLWISSATGVQGVLWSMLLSNPSLGDGSFHSKSLPKYSTDDQVAADESVRHHRHNHRMQFCVEDKSCNQGMFCDVHYGICDYIRKEGGRCRHDNHCDNGQECVFGRCRKHVKKGENGARCLTAKDCDAGSCCARHHGEHVCKPRLPIGHKCFIPKGGLDYAINEMCPCEVGLMCKSAQDNSKYSGVEIITASSDVRCLRP